MPFSRRFLFFVSLFFTLAFSETVTLRPTCHVPAGKNGSDDSSAIVAAFKKCGKGGHIVFGNDTYNIGSVMNTTGLSDCQIDIHGTLLWNKDIKYWLNHSMPIGYQNQSTVWFLGGVRVTINGHGIGTINGNGQAWYDYINGRSNYPGRPMSITFRDLHDSNISGLRFVKTQMWTMAIMYSSHVELEDIYVNNTSSGHSSDSNTDGADTMFSDNIVFRRWTIDNGDDAIAIKANSTNIFFQDSTFHHGQGFAIGSIGQYDGVQEIIENVTVTNITCVGSKHASYIKTWTGEQSGYPPNGGGGGLGYVRNVLIDGVKVDKSRSDPFVISQCTSYTSTSGDCDSSKFKISGITFRNVKGVANGSSVANMYCSKASGGCRDIALEDISVKNNNTGNDAAEYLCTHVADPKGFNCTGKGSNTDGE